jgi:hypothetical protein
VTNLVISIQDSIPLRGNVINLPSCTKLQLQTRHPRDLANFCLPKLTSLALLAYDILEVSFMNEVIELMKTAEKWTTKPTKLFIGLAIRFNQWKMLLRILGEFAESVQIAVPRNCPEGDKLHGFMFSTDGLERRQIIELFPYVKHIRYYVIAKSLDYANLADRSAEGTLGIPMKQ